MSSTFLIKKYQNTHIFLLKNIEIPYFFIKKYQNTILKNVKN